MSQFIPRRRFNKAMWLLNKCVAYNRVSVVAVGARTSRWSDSPLVRRPNGPKTHWSDGPLVRKPIGTKTHWSEKVSLVRKALVRISVSLVRKPVGPKKCHWSENSGSKRQVFFLNSFIYYRQRLIMLMTGKTTLLVLKS